MNHFLSVIIPAYNEGHRVASTIEALDKYLGKQLYEYEILVVNDGSGDNTVEIVRSLIPHIKNLRLIDNKVNKGKGGVVKQGMLEARGEARLFMDADSSVSIEQIENFLPFLCLPGKPQKECFEIVIGSIEVRGAVVEEHALWYRRFLGKLAKLLIRTVAGLWSIHDTQRGFKLFSRKAAESIFPKQTILRWGFDIEILLIAKKQGFRIKEIPVHWVNPPDSKVTLKSYINTLLELAEIKWNEIKGFYD